MSEQEPSGLLAGWLDLASGALAWVTTVEVPPPTLTLGASRGSLLLTLLSGQPRALALLLAGLVYSALLPVAAVALLAFRRRYNSRSQDITHLYNVAWYAYCFGLAVIVASGLVTALAIVYSCSAFSSALNATPVMWHESLERLQQFVNSTGRELSNAAQRTVTGRLRDATDLLDSNFTQLFEQSLAEAVAKDLNATSNCSTEVRAVGRSLQRQGLQGLGRALVAAAEWCTRLERRRDFLLHAAAKKVDNLTKHERTQALAKIKGQTARPNTYLGDARTALSGLERAKQRAQAAIPAVRNGMLDFLARAGVRYASLLSLFDVMILALLASGTVVGIAARRAQEAPTGRGALSHGAGKALTVSAWLMVLFCFLNTPLAVGVLLLDVGLESQVCAHFRARNWTRLDAVASVLWPPEERGTAFRPLEPSLLVSRCASDDDALLFPPPPPALSEVISPTIGVLDITDGEAMLDDEEVTSPQRLQGLLNSSLSHSWLPLTLRRRATSLMAQLSNSDATARQAPKAVCAILRSMVGRYYSNYLTGVKHRLAGGPSAVNQLGASPGLGSCKPLYEGFMSSLTSLCGPLHRGLTGYWFALSLDVLRYTLAVVICLGASKYLLRMYSYSYEGEIVEEVREETSPVPRHMWAKQLRAQPPTARLSKAHKEVMDPSAGDLRRVWPSTRGHFDTTQLPVKVLPSKFICPETIAVKRRQRSRKKSPHKGPETRRRSPTKGRLSPWGEPSWAPRRKIRWRQEDSYRTISSAPYRRPYGFSEADLPVMPQQNHSAQAISRWH